MSKYDEIINMPHHVSEIHKPMSPENRAAQFAPFAALTGHDEAIAETARLTTEKIELSEDEATRLNRQLQYLLSLEDSPEVTITHFVADRLKQGGHYERTKGRIRKIDDYDPAVILTSGDIIHLSDVYAVSCNLFGAIFDIL